MLALPPIVLYPLLVLGGIAIGTAAAFTGLGGGFLMVPLMLGAGMAVTEAVGTSFLAILIISGAALFAHAKLSHVDRWLGAMLGLGGAAGAQVGARLLDLVPERAFRLLFALVLVGLAARLGLHRRRASRGDRESAGPERRRGPWTYGVFVLLGVAVGVAAAFTGLGGGFVVVPAAILLGLSAAQAVGTSFLAILIISVSALVAHARLAHVDWSVGLALGLGGVVGAQAGARLVERVSQRTFRRIFALLLLILAGHVLLG